MEQEKPNNATLIIICFGVICFLIGVSLGFALSV